MSQIGVKTGVKRVVLNLNDGQSLPLRHFAFVSLQAKMAEQLSNRQ